MFARLADDAMNADWHRRHVLPKGASTTERIAWHREHQKKCACRPIPAGLKKEMARDPAIDAYLATVSPPQRKLLQQLRKRILAIVPQAEECISYGLPAFRVGGKVVGGFAATSTGCSYYPFSGTTLATLARELAGFSRTKSALHFGPQQPLPASLVRRLLETRIAATKVRTK